jgi:hypothetical protein
MVFKHQSGDAPMNAANDNAKHTLTVNRRGWNWVAIIRKDGVLFAAGVHSNKLSNRQSSTVLQAQRRLLALQAIPRNRRNH